MIVCFYSVAPRSLQKSTNLSLLLRRVFARITSVITFTRFVLIKIFVLDWKLQNELISGLASCCYLAIQLSILIIDLLLNYGKDFMSLEFSPAYSKFPIYH